MNKVTDGPDEGNDAAPMSERARRRAAFLGRMADGAWLENARRDAERGADFAAGLCSALHVLRHPMPRTYSHLAATHAVRAETLAHAVVAAAEFPETYRGGRAEFSPAGYVVAARVAIDEWARGIEALARAQGHLAPDAPDGSPHRTTWRPELMEAAAALARMCPELAPAPEKAKRPAVRAGLMELARDVAGLPWGEFAVFSRAVRWLAPPAMEESDCLVEFVRRYRDTWHGGDAEATATHMVNAALWSTGNDPGAFSAAGRRADYLARNLANPDRPRQSNGRGPKRLP